MREKKMKNKGITLIALVVTIIILLILAGVTIATLMGDNGILTKANDAKRETEIAEVKERAQLDIANWVADKMENGESSTINNPDLVRTILNEANLDVDNRYYKEVTDEGVVTPNDYVVPIEELYTNGMENIEAGEVLESERPTEWESNKVKPISDGEGGVIPLPDGFAYVGGTKSEGIVISDDSADERKGTSWEVAQTLQGNQFVWVPVEIDEDFKTYEGYQEGQLQFRLTECKEPFLNGYENEEKEYKQMKNSVLKYDGFYLGRYEAGVEGENRRENEGITDEVVIKQGKNVFNYIGWSNSEDMTNITGGAFEKAKTFSENNEYSSVNSTLIYGVQWDASMQFIDSNYKDGNCNVNTSFVANSTEKGNYSGILEKTGAKANYAIKNIYDLAGNVDEWTMESYHYFCRTNRGGSYNSISAINSPASYRVNGQRPSASAENIGFRISLYL